MSAVKNIKNEMSIVKNSEFSIEDSIRSAENLFRSGNNLAAVIENADGVPFQLVFGPRAGEGHYIHIGDGIKTLLEIDPADFTEQVFQKMIEKVNPLLDNIPADISLSRAMFINGEFEKYKVEVLVTTASGKKKWVRDSSLPIKDEESGKVIGSFGILFDVSEGRQIISDRADSDNEDECDRLKNAFLHNISHEVRTPLNAIIGFSALLCEPEQEYNQKQEFINMINNSSDHFLEVMDNILEISRIEAGSVTPAINEIDPDQVMKRIFSRFRKSADEKRIQLKYDVPEGEVLIKTDGFKLSQVMNNLIDNAIKFTMAGKVMFGYELKTNNIEFYVRDTGLGIQEEHKPKIFNKFYQADSGMTRRFPGTGLGLSISKAYIEMLGGSIGFNSKPGEGSTFRFTLPL